MGISVYYGPKAYEGYAQALAVKFGLKFKVKHGAKFGVDENGVIQLKGMSTYQTAEEFRITCAALMHEMAHVKYGSHIELAGTDRRAKDCGNKSTLYQSCLNAAFDVADELGLGRSELDAGNPYPQEELANFHAHNWKTYKDKYADPEHPNPLWQVLSTAIIKHNCGKPRMVQNKVLKKKLADLGIDITKVFTTLGYLKQYDRWAGNHTMVRRVARRLARLLEPLERPESEEPEDMPKFPGGLAGGPGGAGDKPQDEQGQEAGTDSSGQEEAQGSLSNGMSQLPESAREASKIEGEMMVMANNAPRPQSPSQTAVVKPPSAGGNLEYRAPGTAVRPHDKNAVKMLLPTCRKIADRIATDGDSVWREDYHRTGYGVTKPERLITDGNCMSRWAMDEHADGCNVGILLDCSYSMERILSSVAGIARAFALGISRCAKTKCWVFGSWCEESLDMFNTVGEMNDTRTGDAMRKANKWLTTTVGKKLMVIITDGDAGDKDLQRRECIRARKAGIEVLAIAISNDERNAQAIAAAFPGAQTAHALDVNRLAVRLWHAASTL